jgi:hypothetical protein
VSITVSGGHHHGPRFIFGGTMALYYKLPDGKTTRSSKTYFKAWRNFAKPICEATGMKLIGFDPEILIGNGTVSIDLPNWFVQKINSALCDD